MAMTFLQWLGSALGEGIAAAPNPRLDALEQKIMDLKEVVAKLTPIADAASAKLVDQANEIAAKDSQIATLTQQLTEATAAAADPADVQALSDAADKLNAAVNPPAPAPTDPAPVDPAPVTDPVDPAPTDAPANP